MASWQKSVRLLDQDRGAARAARRPSAARRELSLTLHEPGGRRVFGIDNAHPLRSTRAPSGRASTAQDHLHRDDTVRPYAYRDAESLLEDFWSEVDAILKERGIE